MSEGVDRLSELTFYLLGIQKSDLDEFAEVMFQVGKWSWEIIIWLLDVLKCDFVEVDEALFEGLERPCKIIFSILGI
jgi:hypothetical protein